MVATDADVQMIDDAELQQESPVAPAAELQAGPAQSTQPKVEEPEAAVATGRTGTRSRKGSAIVRTTTPGSTPRGAAAGCRGKQAAALQEDRKEDAVPAVVGPSGASEAVDPVVAPATDGDALHAPTADDEKPIIPDVGGSGPAPVSDPIAQVITEPVIPVLAEPAAVTAVVPDASADDLVLAPPVNAPVVAELGITVVQPAGEFSDRVFSRCRVSSCSPAV